MLKWITGWETTQAIKCNKIFSMNKVKEKQKFVI
jgi:hypothetical protein